MTCKWTQDDDGDYETGCGQTVCTAGCTLKETEWAWCPYCGKKIEEVKP